MALVETVGEKFREGRIFQLCGHAKHVRFGVVLEAAPAQMPVEYPERRPVFFQVEKKCIRARLEILAVNLYVLRERDGRSLIRTGAPRRTLTRPKTLVHKAVMHQLTPDVSRAIVGGGIVDAWAVVLNRNLDRADPLRDLRALSVAVGRIGQLGCFLRKAKCGRQDNK